MKGDWTRRAWLASAAGGGLAMAASATEPKNRKPEEPFRYGLNTATLMGQKLSIVEEVEIASRAGYQAIEPWVRELDQYVKGGGNLKDSRQTVGGSRPARRERHRLFRVDRGRRRQAQGGPGERPPRHGHGTADRRHAHRRPAGRRHRPDQPDASDDRPSLSALLDIGDQIGVVPQVEVWGFSKTLNRLGDAAYVAVESGHEKACILADVYHLYKGGSGYGGVHLLSGDSMHVLHMNDYPAEPPRTTITDAHRVYPGEGVAPLKALLRDLRRIGFRGVLSLELFNREYWKRDALAVARTGVEKMCAVVASSLG